MGVCVVCEAPTEFRTASIHYYVLWFPIRNPIFCRGTKKHHVHRDWNHISNNFFTIIRGFLLTGRNFRNEVLGKLHNFFCWKKFTYLINLIVNVYRRTFI